MKLNKKIKDKIDNYFQNITAEELCRVVVNKYGFKENIDINIDNQSFDIVKKISYTSSNDNSMEVNSINSISLAA
ncbi:hypothetical protein [Tenacibaculum finnmarkense]|uniref:Uncharacterized protein n=2 Tax=Tenacibaculum finnmarkense TaxID=2781243 RepID=A0A2I2M8E4_9FLAO|nr:hypothetical protein [Tenacibaculum finnmarkense]MBE7644695.1 hypothetical protein [Tenacibaculum finnmarkense genomovar ulcerans]MBE7646860.1 hypothetical protein [Tenacibaculum finnmarkense genomovar ulcerans]MBE7659133.1 hypothetical protein [Tenacibaculum finnmarkense genomovar finnmarkense]MBE7696999.1 hypothetical protein [Tenacibaculum finnmarkense genomovar ulcerans]MCD8409340.1 hypothetical protein [Tenacibaculum finnmarkense genomovar ulcerans]